jgi:hypothetical protein
MPPLYVPLLKGKEGEFTALEEIESDVRDLILPLVEVPRVPFDYVNERPAKTLDEHVSGVAGRLRECWPERPLYLDMPWFSEAELLADGTAAIGRVLGDCRTGNVAAIPVVRTTSSAPYLAAVRAHLAECEDGACIRVTPSDFDEDGEIQLGEQLKRTLDALAVDNLTRTDLILDLANIQDVGREALVARAVIAEMPHLPDWRRFIFAATSFPENLSEVDAATTTALPRLEWELWQRLRRRSALRTDSLFGDYAIAHPIPAELDPRTMRMSASIRYTTDENWLIVKGRNVRQYGFDQYYDLCRTLSRLPEFSGEGFSWGDRFIARCARGEAGPGNATTWRKVGTNHHLTLVARTLATVRAA